MLFPDPTTYPSLPYPLLETEQGTKAVVFEFEEPFRIIKRILSGNPMIGCTRGNVIHGDTWQAIDLSMKALASASILPGAHEDVLAGQHRRILSPETTFEWVKAGKV
jgi:hypothetical protein